MKFILVLSACLLMVLFFACNGKFSKTNPSVDSSIVAVDKSESKREEVVQEMQMYTPPVVQGHSTSKGKVTLLREEEFNTEDYDNIVENGFHSPKSAPLSTFSIDVDAASYSNVRRYIDNGIKPPPGAVRIEEMINYFDYDYAQPNNEDPFSVNTEVAECPWNKKHRLVHIGLQGKIIPTQDLPPSNLVFLIDVSGSMEDENKLPLVKQSLSLLTNQLRESDKVSIVVYAGAAGQVLPATSGADKRKILDAVENLHAGGSTAGGEGIVLAYAIARKNFIAGGNNRIILATDGDFNVGLSSDDALVNLISRERRDGIYLSVLGFGMGNYKDNKMQKLADNGNGNHYYIDNLSEARKIFVKEFGGTLFTIAKDVKVQVEFNPALVSSYRLIGYENRMLHDRDFNDDKKDAGELGSGHSVTALYEIIPAGVPDTFAGTVDKLRYQQAQPGQSFHQDELITIKLRYKRPSEEVSRLIVKAVPNSHFAIEQSSENLRFSAAVACFGMVLRNSEFRQLATYDMASKLAAGALGTDPNGYRKEFQSMVLSMNRMAKK